MRVLETVFTDSRGRLGIAIVGTLVLAGALAPLVTPYDPLAQPNLEGGQLLPPSFSHPFGTDDLSRDLLSRVVFGARISLAVAVLSMTVAGCIGTVVGGLSGLVGGRVDQLVMRSVDAALAFPRIILLIVVLAFWSGVTVLMLVLVLGLTSWFDTSRLVRAEVLSLRKRDFVLAAKASGSTFGAILVKHALPNVAGPVIVSATLGVGQMVLLEAGLSFLGIGISRPTPAWGSMIADSQYTMLDAWWTAAFPGMAIVLTVIGFSLLGDVLRDAMDPKTT